MKTLGLIFIAATVAACNQSPLLNHKNAEIDRPSVQPAAETKEEKKEIPCPLKFEKNSLCASIEWTVGPIKEEYSAFTLKFYSPVNGELQALTQGLRVTAYMPSMGHGTSPVKIALSKDAAGTGVAGSYSVTEVFFSMSGDWEIRVRLKGADGVEELAVLKVSL